MYAENLEAAKEVIRRLFDPRRTYKDVYISPKIKMAYLQHYLESRWAEIVIFRDTKVSVRWTPSSFGKPLWTLSSEQ